MTYKEIVESSGVVGENWSVFVPEEGNEKFLNKLHQTLKKFDYLNNYIEKLWITPNIFSKEEVDVLVKYSDGGVFNRYNVYNDPLDPDMIDDTDEEAFVQSFYRLNYFPGCL